MLTFRSLARRFGSFASHQKGTTAITFALSIVPVLLAMGAAVDYARYSVARTAMQAALDSGALAVATASSLPDAKREKAGSDTFEANLENTGIRPSDVNYSFTLTGNRVSASARYPMASGFMQIAGLTNFAVDVETEITLPSGRKAEVVLVLDYSGSMEEKSGGQVKYVAMKNAAKKLVTDLETSNPKKIKVGLVPFSHHVYLTMPEKYIMGKTGSGNWTGCVQDRPHPANLTDATPGTDNKTKWGQPFAKVHEKLGCAAYAPNKLKVAPLTDDFSGIRAQLEAMRPYQYTHIALGAEFGYHLLSPNEPFTEGAAYTDKGVRKIMVLLTDGRQTEPAFGDGSRTVGNGESNLEKICQNMKDSGITIVTIAFDLRDKDTRKRLRDCSSNPDKDFHVAEESSDIAAAFEDIKQQIVAQVFISR